MEKSETSVKFYDFNEQPLMGMDPILLGREFGITIEILGGRDEILGAYPIRISGSGAGVDAYIERYGHTWKGTTL
ncbi:hypothetical protein C4552_04055 [Candidatus Parcubacteria bacterium]|nr:MAG: hypothetical protein C4552_04055 [Candidatus Parcubacteria bacterium]